MIRRTEERRKEQRDRKGHAINQTQNYVAEKGCVVRGNDSEAEGGERERDTVVVIAICELSECVCDSLCDDFSSATHCCLCSFQVLDGREPLATIKEAKSVLFTHESGESGVIRCFPCFSPPARPHSRIRARRMAMPAEAAERLCLF